MLKQELLREIPELKKFVSTFTGYGKYMFSLMLIVGTVSEMLKTLMGRGDTGGKLTMSLIIAISISAFNSYQSDVINVGFSISEEILKIGKVNNSLEFVFDNFSSKELGKINSNNSADNKPTRYSKTNKFDIGEVSLFSKENLNFAKSLFNSVPLGITWIISKGVLILNRSIYSVLYNLFIVIGPLVAWLSILSGWENSIKAFWQSFLFFTIAPIVFSLTYVISFHVIFAPNATEPIPVETLLNTIVCAIMLLGSFVTTAYIVTTKPLTSFAEQASMMGAMALATGGVMGAKSAITNTTTKGIGLAKTAMDNSVNPRLAKMLGTSDPLSKKFQVPGSRISKIPNYPSKLSSSKSLDSSTNSTLNKSQFSKTGIKDSLNSFKDNISSRRIASNQAKERAIKIKNNKALAKPSNIKNVSDAGRSVKNLNSQNKGGYSAPFKKERISEQGSTVRNISKHKPSRDTWHTSAQNNELNKNKNSLNNNSPASKKLNKNKINPNSIGL
jgi:hypothetical protein